MTQEPDLLEKKETKGKSPHKKTTIILMVLSFLALSQFVRGALQNMMPCLEGKARSAEELEIQTLSEGVLSKINIENSAHVKKGDVICQFDNEDLELSLLSAIQKKETLLSELKEIEKEKALSIKRFESAKVLYENGVISQHDLEAEELSSIKVQNDFEVKRRECEEASHLVDALQEEKENLSVKAPFEGIFLGSLESKQKTFFKKGEMLGVLFNPGRFYLETELAEERVGRIETGDRAHVHFKVIPGSFAGKVVQIDAKIKETVEKVYKTKYVAKVLIELDSPPQGLVPGMRGSAQIMPGFALSRKEVNG